jgi:CRISPR/Cas system CMR-associated protein Cmr5 small subunit
MIKMYIAGEEVVSDKEFTIKEEMLSASSTILNNCYPKSWENDKDFTSRFYYPKDYSKFTMYNDNNLIFAGIVKNSGDISLNPRYPHYCSLQILDFKTFLSEGDTLDFVISEKTVLEAIQMVIDAVADYGFVLGNVDILGGDDVIGAYSTQNKTAYDVFQYLAEITQSRWTTRMIDEDTVAVDFYDPLLMPRANDIEYTQEYWENNDIIDISFSYGTRDYRNKQIILSDEVFGGIDYTETIITDGYNRIFTTTSNIGKINQILVNGVSKTFATNEDKELGVDANFYYSINKNTFESNETEDIYSAGNSIVITYTPIIKGRQVVSNGNEIDRISEQINRKGVIARYETRNDIVDLQSLNKIAQTYLKYKGSAEILLTISTNNTNLLNIGEVVYFSSPIDELKQDYMVKSKEIQYIVNKSQINIFYVYELTSSFNSENAINYFDNQRNKTYGNIEEGQFITRNVDINNTATIIFDNLHIQEITVIGDNVLNSSLNIPFVS